MDWPTRWPGQHFFSLRTCWPRRRLSKRDNAGRRPLGRKEEGTVQEGPQLWANWKAYDPHRPANEAFEAALYSDVDLYGRVSNPAWPVDLMSAIAPLRTGLKLTAVARIQWNTTAEY